MKKLKIRHRLLIILLIEAAAISLLGWLALHFALQMFSEQIYRESSDKFNLYSHAVQEKLKTIDNLAYSIATDIDIQEQLDILNNMPLSYESSIAVKRLEERLFVHPIHQVSSIVILDNNARQYTVGHNPKKLDPSTLADIRDLARSHKGASAWGEDLRRHSFYMVREIRKIAGLDLGTLGVLVILVEPDRLVQPADKTWTNYGSQLVILSEGRVVYPVDLTLSLESLAPIPKTQGYRITDIDHRKYLVTHSTFPYTGWTFVNLVPYERIFQMITVTKQVLIVFHIVIFFIIVYVGLRFSKSITQPIEQLNAKIGKASLGNFESKPPDLPKQMDELGLINRNFDQMMNKIDSLIKENYVKQMLLKETEYQALKATINPHFLYNTLESINWMAKTNGQKDISRMVKALGQLLRSSIDKKAFATLQEEIATLEHYILIQKIRFADRLECAIDIPETFRQLQIPQLTLQPIAENSIRYVLEQYEGVCEISVSAELQGKRLIVSVRDNGPGMDPDYLARSESGTAVAKGSGIGLKNIHDRLVFMFGSDYGIRIDSSPGKGTTVNIHIPYKYNGEMRNV
ncbi:sensor histidine kinase [Paenibacillus sp.]|uniref:cache domain-containing sensor histidine kinase n=1 Tax=Paenibacillus sp. TaxID=58172 RepID=UPI002D331B5D|nr:sensor histidine kinase [Paenibacillus sp.]HZG86320.1 sensor histidine kinase [Paenibacillus sp.]